MANCQQQWVNGNNKYVTGRNMLVTGKKLAAMKHTSTPSIILIYIRHTIKT